MSSIGEWVTACLLHNEPGELIVCGKVKGLRPEAEAKASAKCAIQVVRDQTRKQVIYPWPG